MAKLSVRDRRAVLIGALVLGAIIGIRFVVMPWVDHWTSVRSEAVTIREVLATNDRKVHRAGLLGRRLHGVYGEIPDAPLKGVQSTKVQFHATVQEVMKASGIKFESIREQKTGSIKQLPGVVLVPLQLVRAQCGVEQLARFLAESQRAKLLIMCDRINIGVSGGKLNVDMTVSTLARKDARP